MANTKANENLKELENSYPLEGNEQKEFVKQISSLPLIGKKGNSLQIKSILKKSKDQDSEREKYVSWNQDRKSIHSLSTLDYLEQLKSIQELNQKKNFTTF